MIEVSFNNGVALIYNVEDWFELRTKYRVIGELIGITKTLSVALPLKLCPEETLLLIKKGVITLRRWNKLNSEPTATDKTYCEENLERIRNEQNIILRNDRKIQVENCVDKILEGRKQKDGCNLSREEVIQEELDKLPELLLGNVINPIYTQHPDHLRGNSVTVLTEELEACTNKTKYLVYEDLWEKGYFVTCGRKFGGDFLVYLGDPISFHAVYIVKCVEDIDKFHNVIEIVAFGRLGNAVKKKFVLAAVSDNKVSYLTCSWIDTEFY